MFSHWILAIIFAFFLGGCAMFVSGTILIRIGADRCGHSLRIVGTVAWFVALCNFLGAIAFMMCGWLVM